MREWMTIDDLSEYLQIPQTRIRHLIKQNRIPFHSKLGSPRFFKPEIDDWMRTDADESQQTFDEQGPFIYRERSIKSYGLTASKILLGETAWNRLPDFIRKTVSLFNETDRSYLYRREFESLMRNFNDYLRVSCQLGLIDNTREGRYTHYCPTEYSQSIFGESDTEELKKIILDSVLNIVKFSMETIPQERHAIYLLWYLLKIRERGLEPEEYHFSKGGENNYYPGIRLGFSVSLCDFLFGKDRSKEQEFLKRWDQYIKAKTLSA